MAIALSGTASALPTGGDDHGGSTQSGGGQSGKGGDNGGGVEPGDDHGNGGGETGDDHGNGGQNASFGRTAVALAAMPSGALFALTGNVDIRAQGNEQRLKVEIEGNFADGSLFPVLANGLAIGTITGRLHHGELEIELENGVALPGGLLPGAVNSIEVRDTIGNSLLLGRFAALTTSTTPTPAPAGGLTKTEVTLVRVSPAATSVGATGHVEFRAQGAQQEFKVTVEAAVPDGTVWQVFANGIQVGTLKFRLNVAEFKIQSENPLPAGLGSLAAISTVNITDGTSSLLSGILK